MAPWRERLSEFVTERTGLAIESKERLDLLESSDRERRSLQRELDLLAYTALDYVGGAPQELKAVERRRLSQKARIVWMRDPLAGASVDLMNDFTFGRGLPKPTAKDKLVQKQIDQAWDDPDNQEVLTTLDAQVRAGTELSLTANLFYKVFDDGEDGKVKLSLLKNDLVETVVRDPDIPQRVMWFVAAEEPYQEWDYVNDQAILLTRQVAVPRKIYYPHWRNIDLLLEEIDRGERDAPNMPPPDKIGDGKIFHVALNRDTNMAFGHPPMDRLLRWFNAYNRFMDARVDLMEASAAFVMKRKVTGTPSQLNKMATQALSRRSALGNARDPELSGEAGPKAGAILVENGQVTHEDFNISTNAPQAAQDAQMLRANVSAGTRFPQSYYGDATNSNLATATSLELPVLKAVESRQEKFEALARFFIDRVIERAVDTGIISDTLTPEEIADIAEKSKTQDGSAEEPSGPVPLGLGEAHEDAIEDEEDTNRDLSYEFSMPSPLKRMMTDLITSIASVATTFDPNNTNIELSRTLLAIALSEGLEMEDAAGAVEAIFPPGYVDPAVQAAQAAQDPTTDPNADTPHGEFAGADGDMHTEDNPYGAPMQSASPEDAQSALGEARTIGRGGRGQVVWLREQRVQDLPTRIADRLEARRQQVSSEFDAAFTPPK